MYLGRVEIIGGGPAGLFAARLIKERMPHASVRVSERSVPDDTFGFGVAFTARTLRAVAGAERATFDRIVQASVPMPPQEMLIDGVSVRAKGNGGGIAIARSRLLAILLDVALRAGVEVDLGVERNLDDVRDARPGSVRTCSSRYAPRTACSPSTATPTPRSSAPSGSRQISEPGVAPG